MKKGSIKVVLIILGILLMNEISKKISVSGTFTLFVSIGIIIYIGYINTSIRELKKRVEQLENQLEN